MKLSEVQLNETVKTGLISFDKAVGGIPRGKISELYGREGSGKTSLSLRVIATTQRLMPGQFDYLYIDTEGAFDSTYARSIGVVDDGMEIKLENDITVSLDEVLKRVETSQARGKSLFVVIDSIAGMTTPAERDKGMLGETIGSVPKALTKFLRLVTIPLLRSNSLIIINNQIRDNVSSMWGGTTTPGGHGLKHWASLRIKLFNSSKKITLGGKDIGYYTTYTVEKKRVTAGVFEGFVDNLPIIDGEGFSPSFDLINAAIKYGVITQNRAMLYYGDLKWRGIGNLYVDVKSNLEFAQEIYEKLSSVNATNTAEEDYTLETNEQ